MAEGLGVVGAVASVAQLIQFSASIVSKGRQIRKSANGALVENADIEAATKQLSDMTTALRDSLKPLFQHAPITQKDQALHNLCQGCIVVAAELNAALEKLKLKGKSRAFSSFYKALKCVRSKDEIESMQKRLELYHSVLQTTILVSLKIEPSTVNIEPASATDLDDHKEDILKALKSSTSDITSNIHDHATALKDMHEQNLAVVNTYTSQQIMEHENTRVEVKRLSISFEEHQAIMAAKLAETQDIVDHAREQDMVEHKKTRFVMESEIAEIKGWIRSLKQQEPKVEQDVKDGIIEYAIRAPTSSPSELQNLKVITNAKFSLWTALQDLLEKLQVLLAMLKAGTADARWSHNAIMTARNLIPYSFLGERLKDMQDPNRVMEHVESVKENSRLVTLGMLLYPIAAGSARDVETAINCGVELNQRLPAQDFRGMTPLMFAVATAYGLNAFDSIETIIPMRLKVRKVIQLLLAHGADPHHVDAEGRDATHVAKNPEYFLTSKDRSHLPVDWTLEQLMELSPDVDLLRLMTLADIVWNGNLVQLRKLLDDVPEICKLADDYHASALGIAAHRGIEEVARLLLEAGACPDGPDPVDSTPLAIAVAMNRLAMVDLLLTHGAEFDSIDRFLGLNPLEYAAREGNQAMCEVFLKHLRSRQDACFSEALSKSLCLAVRHYQTATVEMLLDHGADVHTNIGIYLAPLEIAAYQSANFGQRIDRMTPRTYVQNKRDNREVPLHLELASETLLKSLQAREEQSGMISVNANSSGSFERLANVSARYHLGQNGNSSMSSSRSASPGIGRSIAVTA